MRILLEWYESEGMTSSHKSDLYVRRGYSNDDGLILIYDKYKVDFEYTEIVILTIWQKDKFVFTYSDQGKLGVELKVSALMGNMNETKVYGNLKGNPETSYGGDFIITFSKGSRKISYSFYERNG